ncbi:MAG: hypothetical protein OHK0053_23450 [Microscillaceae bacterium]
MLNKLFGWLRRGPKLPSVNAVELEKALKKRNTVVLDVRTPGEFAQGHIPGAKLMNLYEPDFAEKISKLDKEKEYYVYCRSGQRSQQAGKKMLKQGFTQVFNLAGGVMAWRGNLKKTTIMPKNPGGPTMR